MSYPLGALLLISLCSGAFGQNVRRPGNDDELRYWLENMVWHHGFSLAEVSAATGLDEGAVKVALNRFEISGGTRPARRENEPMRVLPYPGGRHPRIGFLEGAIDPQRETKASVFTPWDPASYVVIDVPEAIWSNLGLTYLAHTHIDTIWTERGVSLPPLEWQQHPGGRLSLERKLPNGIGFGTRLDPLGNSLAMEMWIHNGTEKMLTDLRAQVCLMLKGGRGFTRQDNANKRFHGDYALCHDGTGKRWIITAWKPCHRAWQNAPVPCLHSDPGFADCAPGKTVRAHGRLWFFEGEDIEAELARLEASGWKEHPVADIGEVAPDLEIPPLVSSKPERGKRVRVSDPVDQTPGVYHVLYLPEDWQPGKRYPVIVEYAGNGPYRNRFGDVSTGLVEGSRLGYGLSGGSGYIWLCLPYLNGKGDGNVSQWWGNAPGHDPGPTIAYCKKIVPRVCREYGGDPKRVILCGFSRGAIACNFIGLHDKEIAGLWSAFMPFSHYDGVRKWRYPGSDRKSALRRLEYLAGRPQLILNERGWDGSSFLAPTRAYLDEHGAGHGKFTFMDSGFRNHDGSWILRPSAARFAARAWLRSVTIQP